MILKLERLLSVLIVTLTVGFFFEHNAGVAYGQDGLHVTTGGNVGIGTTSPNSALEVAGPIATALVNKTVAYTVSASDSIVTADASGGGFTITLPTASGIAGRSYTFKKIDSSSNVVKIDGNGLETIDGVGDEFEMDVRNEYFIVVSDGTNWLKIGGDAVAQVFIDATGGIITYDGGYKIHTFNSSGTFTVTSGTGDVEYLVVGGGGAGGSGAGGGGGAGGYRTATGHSVSAQAYPITVGSGGASAGVGNLTGNNGGDSVFGTITSIGGGGGGSYSNPGNGSDGGSGGGIGKDQGSYSGGHGTAGQGYDGGMTATGESTGSGGGGGASEAGENGSTSEYSGDGGDGLASSITGSSVIRAGGGGGSSPAGHQGVGGSGGGGEGGSDGTANTGSGGGGGTWMTGAGGAGGSGVVIIRYQFE